MDFWTVDRIEQLRMMKAEGKTGAEIAHALGCSRNAVLGKTHRLGLGVSKQAPGISAELLRNTTPKRAYTRRQRQPGVASKVGFLLPALPEPPKDAAVDIVAVTGCRWAITADDVPRDQHRFCNAPVEGERSYCPYHEQEKRAKAQPKEAVKRFKIPTVLLRMAAA